MKVDAEGLDEDDLDQGDHHDAAEEGARVGQVQGYLSRASFAVFPSSP
jgi:hypothetical protein